MKSLLITGLLLVSGSVALAADGERTTKGGGLEQPLPLNRPSITVLAWDQVYHLWLAWLQADPTQRRQAEQQLKTALQALDKAWQPSHDQAKPFFYAIDMATRMQT